MNRLNPVVLGITLSLAFAVPGIAADTVPVTVENFVRAESDLYFTAVALQDKAFGKFFHRRELSPIDDQHVIRQNRDTLYSAAVFDLDAGPVTVTLPDAGKRFMSLQIITEDHYTPPAVYAPANLTITREDVGTRYVLTAVRTLVDPNNPDDMTAAHGLQDGIKVEQPNGPGEFAVPKWDAESQKKIREALLVLATTIKDTSKAFGTKDQVEPVQRLIGAASAWGANPPKDATYLNFVPPKNDGRTIYKLDLKDVPVDGFWSISVYNKEGFYEKNEQGAYTLNNITAKTNAEGAYVIQFGGCEDKIANCLPTSSGWNYMVRLYRPREEILNGSWKFPEAEAQP
ncbi:DUF1254 domain-containing protein [Phyllobacterium endophyticum]|uniref:Carboxylesterase n=2 Tax=Phyllobacterium endophyticum TaxID=1149773 RepID=A0A2P7AXE0_9HYPH|nr:carboxylesterase [Phyllobacterium endophyticum]TYR39449.1 DUF1254 domain-containing protein [Phyllobacterium endophyticum]